MIYSYSSFSALPDPFYKGVFRCHFSIKKEDFPLPVRFLCILQSFPEVWESSSRLLSFPSPPSSFLLLNHSSFQTSFYLFLIASAFLPVPSPQTKAVFRKADPPSEPIGPSLPSPPLRQSHFFFSAPFFPVFSFYTSSRFSLLLFYKPPPGDDHFCTPLPFSSLPLSDYTFPNSSFNLFSSLPTRPLTLPMGLSNHHLQFFPLTTPF